MKNNNQHERVPKRPFSGTSSNGDIDKSTSNQHIRTTKQSETTQQNHSTSTIASEPLDSNREQHHQHKEKSHRKQLASNTHYILPTAPSLQYSVSSFIFSPPVRDEIQLRVPADADETFTDQQNQQTERQASEQHQQEVNLKQRKVSEKAVKLYARYLQWEWVALSVEECITEQKALIREQLLRARNTHTEAEPSSDGCQLLEEWEETYLLPVQEDVGLLETNGLDAKVAETCLLEIQTAISQLDNFREQIPETAHHMHMIFLEDCFRYMQEIYRDMIDLSYASLLDSV